MLIQLKIILCPNIYVSIILRAMKVLESDVWCVIRTTNDKSNIWSARQRTNSNILKLHWSVSPRDTEVKKDLRLLIP